MPHHHCSNISKKGSGDFPSCALPAAPRRGRNLVHTGCCWAILRDFVITRTDPEAAASSRRKTLPDAKPGGLLRLGYELGGDEGALANGCANTRRSPILR